MRKEIFFRAGKIVLILFIFALSGCNWENTETGQETKGPYLIMAQRPTPSGYPAVIARNIPHIEDQPFDGMFINSVAGWNLMNGQAVSYDSIYREFAVLKGAFKKFRHNFIYVFNYFPGDFWDDSAWEITARNFAGSWDNYELLGPFFVGMMLGKGETATIIDGGEVYQYRTESDFKNSYEIRKYEIASEETNSWFIPYQLRLDWPNRINILIMYNNIPHARLSNGI